jgi:ribonuclease J
VKNHSEATKLVPGAKDFWFLPLGGANEIGMNLNVFGHNQKWLIVDLGITFSDRLGVEVVAPDPSFLIANRESIAGLVVTHAHEDHVGGIPYLWPYLRCPVYATPFTMNIIRQKIADKPWKHEVPLVEIPMSGTFKVADFDLEFITLTHSILEPNAVRIETPLGVVLHSGDWKIDPDPMVGDATDVNRLKEIGDKGVRALICDSTNVFNDGSAGSEKAVRAEMLKLMAQFPDNRLTVACFASNIARVETVVKCAAQMGRKVALVGRSLHRMVQAAKDTGYLKDMPTLIGDIEAMKLPAHKVCFLTTGSQGESRAALSRIASGSHPIVEFGENDVVFFSSRMIPGNEKNISAMQNSLIHQGVQIITASEADIHVSGHPARDELRQMYEWVRPEVLIPVHGDARHLDEHAKFGIDCGIDTIVVPENGSLIQLNKDDVNEIELLPSGRWVYEGKRMINQNSTVLRERSKLSTDGIIVATLVVDAYGQFLQPPKLSIRGLCDTRKEEDDLTQEIYMALRDALEGEYKSETAKREALEAIIRKTTNRMLAKKPTVDVHVIAASM